MHTGAYTWYNFTRAHFNLQLPINYIKPPVNIKEFDLHVLDIIEINIQQYVLFTHSDLHILFRIISFHLFYAITCISYQKIIEHIYICRFRKHKPKPVKPGIQTNIHIHQTQNNYIIFTCETRCTYAIKTKTSSTLTRSHVFTEVAKTFIKFDFILNIWLVIPCSYNK